MKIDLDLTEIDKIFWQKNKEEQNFYFKAQQNGRRIDGQLGADNSAACSDMGSIKQVCRSGKKARRSTN